MARNKIILWSFVFSGLMLLASTLVAFLSLPVSSGDIIIRFDNYHNEIVWAGSLAVFLGVILIAAVVVAANFFLTRHIYERERFLAYVLAVGTGAVSFLFLVGTVAVAFIN